MTSDTAADTAPQAAPGRLKPVVLTAIIIIVIDQLTKIWAVAELTDGAIDLFWTFRLRLIYNTGASFGMGAGFGRWLGLLIVVVVAFVIRYARTVESHTARVLLGAIVGGAIGNLLDRLFRGDNGFLGGGVVDFFDLQWWPVFNVADIAVVCGAIALMVLSLRLDS